MFKAVCLLTGLCLPIVVSISPTMAQDASLQATGICGLYNHSGYLVVNEAGQLVNVVDYCQNQQTQQAQPEQPSHPGTSAFWRAFATSADSEARAIATTLGSDQVIAYGATICPFLNQGGTLQQLRQIQLDGDLPSGFETAVTVAAIQAYCPVYRSELGR